MLAIAIILQTIIIIFIIKLTIEVSDENHLIYRELNIIRLAAEDASTLEEVNNCYIKLDELSKLVGNNRIFSEEITITYTILNSKHKILYNFKND